MRRSGVWRKKRHRGTAGNRGGVCTCQTANRVKARAGEVHRCRPCGDSPRWPLAWEGRGNPLVRKRVAGQSCAWGKDRMVRRGTHPTTLRCAGVRRTATVAWSGRRVGRSARRVERNTEWRMQNAKICGSTLLLANPGRGRFFACGSAHSRRPAEDHHSRGGFGRDHYLRSGFGPTVGRLDSRGLTHRRRTGIARPLPDGDRGSWFEKGFTNQRRCETPRPQTSRPHLATSEAGQRTGRPASPVPTQGRAGQSGSCRLDIGLLDYIRFGVNIIPN
jgi:hypothetical protein